jgi:tubulin polyglutamylase TTLL6/13
VFQEGLARFATHPYEPPNPKNLSNMFMHLTNYAINKNADNYK